VRIAPLVREWRQRRRLSREELARAAGVSARELAHVETGRERPSRELLLALAGGLELPARERDGLLRAAGHAPPAAGEDEPARAAIKRMLERHEPFPALAVDHGWTLVAANAAWPLLTHDVAPALLEPPVNVVRLALHPAGLARHVADLDAWRALALERLRRAGLDELAAEVAGYPEPDRPGSRARPPAAFLAVRLRSPYGTLTFLPAVTTFPTAVTAGMAESTVIALHPVDTRTRAAARAAASRPSGR
jgi:transcriptional regulator with XRE-family HTH domain